MATGITFHDGSADIWREHLPHSDPAVLKSQFEALTDQARVQSSTLDVEYLLFKEHSELRVSWVADTRRSSYEVTFGCMLTTGGDDRLKLHSVLIARDAQKGQGFGFGVLKIMAGLAMAHSYDSLAIDNASDDGRLFWPKQGARIQLQDIVEGAKVLRWQRQARLAAQPDFQAGNWGPLLRDRRSLPAMRRMLDKRWPVNSHHFIAMTFDRDALQAVLAKPLRAPQPPTPWQTLRRKLKLG